MLRLQHLNTHGVKGGRVIAKLIREKKYGTHVLRWATILAGLLMFKEMSLSRFTGWAVVTAFCSGIVLGVMMW
jgi:hypothetical protein